MKTKMFLLAALVGAAAMSANAGVRFGFSIGLPLPVVISTPVVCATPVMPAPVTAVQTVPPCPSVDYVWVPGYWSYCTTGRVWVSGAWCYRPVHVAYGRYYAGRRW
ncbi:MAG: hypothetical protein ACLP2Y_06460 [Limisphaerales bacterium]